MPLNARDDQSSRTNARKRQIHRHHAMTAATATATATTMSAYGPPSPRPRDENLGCTVTRRCCRARARGRCATRGACSESPSRPPQGRSNTSFENGFGNTVSVSVSGSEKHNGPTRAAAAAAGTGQARTAQHRASRGRRRVLQSFISRGALCRAERSELGEVIFDGQDD